MRYLTFWALFSRKMKEEEKIRVKGVSKSSTRKLTKTGSDYSWGHCTTLSPIYLLYICFQQLLRTAEFSFVVINTWGEKFFSIYVNKYIDRLTEFMTLGIGQIFCEAKNMNFYDNLWNVYCIQFYF